MTATALRFTTRHPGNGCSPDRIIYTVHRADCPAIARVSSREVGDGIDKATLLRKVRHSLGATACKRCHPDVS